MSGHRVLWAGSTLGSREAFRNRATIQGRATKGSRASGPSTTRGFNTPGLLVVALAILVAVGASWAPVSAETRITIIGGVLGGSGYMQALAFNQVLVDHVPGVLPVVQASPGYVANARRLVAGLADFGVVTTVDAYRVLHRQGQFQNATRYLLQLYPTVPPVYVHFITLQNSPVRSFSDINGRRINLLTRGSLAEDVGGAILEALGVKPARISYLPHDEASSAVQSGEVDVLVAGGIAPTYSELALRTPLRVLSFTEEEARVVEEKLPFLPVLQADFAPYYRGAGAARVGAPWAIMAARHDVDEGLVYQAVKAVFDNYNVVVQIYRPAAGLKPEMVLETRAVLHPGALRYYEEIGIRVPETMRPSL